MILDNNSKAFLSIFAIINFSFEPHYFNTLFKMFLETLNFRFFAYFNQKCIIVSLEPSFLLNFFYQNHMTRHMFQFRRFRFFFTACCYIMGHFISNKFLPRQIYQTKHPFIYESRTRLMEGSSCKNFHIESERYEKKYKC